MTEEDDLFGIGTPRVTRSGATSEDERVKEMWHLWADSTKRPDRTKPDREVGSLYRQLLREHRPHDHLLDIVAGAAKMPRRPRDPKDTRRLLMALRNPKHGALALGLLDDDSAPDILYPQDDEDLQFLSTPTDVAESCGVPLGSWTPQDQDAAADLIQNYDAESLDRLAEDVKRLLGRDVVAPKDLLVNRHSSKIGSTSRNSSRSTYNAGVAEQARTAGIDFYADVSADRLMVKGDLTIDKIKAFHDLAPTGYWDAVLAKIDSGLTPEEAYENLQKTWKWHPDMRGEPR